MISYNYVNLVTESVIFDEKPIFHNKEMWDNNECNIIFITGHSGAAKSTTGAKMATESYSLDDVIEQYRFSDENFKEYGDLIYSYFNSIGKKYRLSLKEIQNTTTEKTYEIPVLHSFIDYAIRYAKSHKNKKFCIEGIQLFQWFEPSEFKDYPVIVLGTSILKSNHRASKRDAADAESKLSKAGAYVKNILSIRHYKNYLDDEKYLKKWRKYFSNDKVKTITESSVSDNGLSNKEILDIITIKKSLSDDDKKNLNMTSYKDYKTTGSKCFIEYDSNTPVAYSIVDIDKNNDADLSVACNPNYRGKGFAYKVLKKAVDYAKSHANNIYYATKANNIASQKLAKKVGLTKIVRDDKEWKTFSINESTVIESYIINQKDILYNKDNK